MNKNLLLTIISIVVAIAALVFILLNPFGGNNSVIPTYTPVSTATTSPVSESGSLGQQISDQVKNPAESLPPTNPFDGTKTNPYKDTYQNPFK